MDKKVLIQDLAAGLEQRKGLSRPEAEAFIRTVFNVIGEYLQADKIVKVKGLGTFKLVSIDSRESVDVNTGERIVIKEHIRISFTPDATMRDAVNKPFAQFETVVLYEGTDVADMERMDYPIDMDVEDEDVEGNADDVLTGKIVSDTETQPEAVAETAPEAPVTELESGVVPEVAEAEAESTVSPQPETEETEAAEPVQEEVPGETELPIQGEVPQLAPVEEETKTESAEEPVVMASPQEEEPVAEQPEPQEAETETVQEEPAPVAEKEKKEEEKHFGDTHADVCQVNTAHVSAQHIEVQKVTHQTVENQHIVQMLPEHKGKRVYLTPWMMFFLVLLVLLLMFVSYYTGYYHLFIEQKEAVAPPRTEVRHKAPKRKTAVRAAKVQDMQPAQSKTDTLMPPPQPVQETVPASASEQKPQRKEPSVSAYPQVKGGAYEIVGTLEEYRLKSGDSLNAMAVKYYGSKDFSVYIVAYNKIATPDIVPEGMLLKIPKLRLKRR